MPALSISQQPEWNNNVYVLATTRIFVIIGVAYLLKNLYALIPLIWGTRSASAAAVVAEGIDLASIVSDTPITMSGATGTGPDLEVNLTHGVPLPQPSYDPRNQAERFRVHTQALSHSTEVSSSPAATQTMPEQDVGVRNNDHHTEEGMHVAVGLTG